MLTIRGRIEGQETYTAELESSLEKDAYDLGVIEASLDYINTNKQTDRVVKDALLFYRTAIMAKYESKEAAKNGA